MSFEALALAVEACRLARPPYCMVCDGPDCSFGWYDMDMDQVNAHIDVEWVIYDSMSGPLLRVRSVETVIS